MSALPTRCDRDDDAALDDGAGALLPVVGSTWLLPQDDKLANSARLLSDDDAIDLEDPGLLEGVGISTAGWLTSLTSPHSQGVSVAPSTGETLPVLPSPSSSTELLLLRRAVCDNDTLPTTTQVSTSEGGVDRTVEPGEHGGGVCSKPRGTSSRALGVTGPGVLLMIANRPLLLRGVRAVAMVEVMVLPVVNARWPPIAAPDDVLSVFYKILRRTPQPVDGWETVQEANERGAVGCKEMDPILHCCS